MPKTKQEILRKNGWKTIVGIVLNMKKTIIILDLTLKVGLGITNNEI